MPGLARTSPRGAAADGADGVGVGGGVAAGVGVGARRLAEHVVGVGVALGLQRRGRGPCAASMVSPSTNWRPISFIAWPTAARTTGSPRRRMAAAQQRGGAGAVVEHAAGQHQAPGGGVDQGRGGVAEMRAPVRGLDLVGDQLVDGLGVGHPQQRLGEAHQPDALLGREAVFGEEGLHHRRRGAGAHLAHQAGRLGDDGGAGGGVEPQAGGERAHEPRPRRRRSARGSRRAGRSGGRPCAAS